MPNTLGGRKVGHVLDIELATGVAVAEVEERRLGVTQQFFSVHDPVMVAGRPQVVGVESESGSGEALVYFSVAGEPYHFWVRVGSSDRGPVVAFSGYCPASDVGFVVTSRELSPDALTKHIGLVPTGVRTMGSLVREGAVPFPTNQWRFEPFERGAPGFLDRKVDALLDLLAPLRPSLSALPATCEAGLSVTSRQWKAWPEGVHLDSAQLGALVGLHAEFDLDI